jgi:hypothetical protein
MTIGAGKPPKRDGNRGPSTAMIPAHTAIVCFKLGLVRSKGRRVSSNCPSDLRPATAEKSTYAATLGRRCAFKKCPGGTRARAVALPFMGRATAARKAKPSRADALPVPSPLSFCPQVWPKDHLAGTVHPPMRLKCWRGLRGPDHESALERWSHRARYNCLRESRVRQWSGRTHLYCLCPAHARRTTEATSRNGASSSAATPRRQTPKTTPPRPRRKGSGSSPSACVATTGSQLEKTNPKAALGRRVATLDPSQFGPLVRTELCQPKQLGQARRSIHFTYRRCHAVRSIVTP